MPQWLGALDVYGRHSHGNGRLFRFATVQSEQPVLLTLFLAAEEAKTPPTVSVRSSPVGCRIEAAEATNAGCRYRLVVEPPADPALEDEVSLVLTGPDGVPECQVELRRTLCSINTGLLGESLEPATHAALLWYAHRRFRELIGLKRFSTGRSGKQVLVFRPRLRAPLATNDPALAASGPHQVLEGAWGSWLLVKTGDRRRVEQEWIRFQTFLADRLHPFVARSDAYLPVAAPGAADEPAALQATLISSFLGGDLLRTETLEEVILGAEDPDRCLNLLDRVAAVLGPWHAPTRHAEQPLAVWERVFYRSGDGPMKLFKRFDFSEDADRRRFAAGISWDVSFIQKDHLHHHLLGRKQPGLLPRLGEIPVRFGLTHGDLTTRNVLCQGDHVWLIDFELAGPAPVLVDFARLEVTLRLWCLQLAPRGENVAAAAETLERHLLDHFHGSAGSLEPVTAQAADLGAEPADLLRVARAIARIRRHATAYCVESYGDRRDYLAVLYLTVLSLLRYADTDAAPPTNFRLLVSLAWVLEEALCRLLGLEPFERGQGPWDAPRLLSRDWLMPEGAPARLRYLMEREDGRRALEPLAATPGVWQNPHHHLDVYDHITLVLAYVEAILRDPAAGLLDPAGLDRRVLDDLRRQGIVLPAIPQPSADPPAPARPEVIALARPVADYLARVLGPEERLLLKWLAVLHDVGKPGTRTLHNGKVQFLGHELYGAQLLRAHLGHLFPEEGLRQRMDELIRRHHLPHQLVSRFTDHPADLDALVKGIATGKVSQKLRAALEKHLKPDREEYLRDFAGVLLHGYADRLAGRGHSIGPTAEVLLTILGFCAQFP